MDTQVYLAIKEWISIKMREEMRPMDTTGERYDAGSPAEAQKFMSAAFGLTEEELTLTSFITPDNLVSLPGVLDHIATHYPQAIAKVLKDGAAEYYYPSRV